MNRAAVYYSERFLHCMKQVFPAIESAGKINFIPSQATKTEEQFYFIVQGLRSTYNHSETLKATIQEQDGNYKKTYNNIIIDYNDTLVPVVIKQYFPLSFIKLIEFWHGCGSQAPEASAQTPKNAFHSIQKEWEICFLQIQANLIFNSSFNFSSIKLPSLHGKFIIEVIQRRDVKHFLKSLPHYMEHILSSSRSSRMPSSPSSPLPSLLCKVIGLFKFKFSLFSSVYFVVYLNPEFIHEDYSLDILNRYYLRGAKLNRNKNYRHLTDSSSLLPDAYSLFFDSNLNRNFCFPKANYDIIMKVIVRDVQFLKKLGHTGYYLGIFEGHFSNKSLSDEFESSNNYFNFAHDLTISENNQFWVLLGGIQCIWKYYGKKEHVNYLRKVTKKATDITVVEPAMYSERFMKMIESVVNMNKL